MELAILILLICILLLLIFYGFYFTKKINGVSTNVHNTVEYVSTAMDAIYKLTDKLSNTFIDCINKVGNQHCSFTKAAIEKSENYHYKAIKIVLESLKVFSDDLDEFEEHIDKSIKEINCTKKKSNSKEIKVE